MQSNPIVVDGVLFATTPTMKVVAVNATTGQELWRFDPSGGATARTRFRHRGVTVHADRVFVTHQNFLWSLDKSTGRPVPSFGVEGRIDLREGLGKPAEGLSVSALKTILPEGIRTRRDKGDHTAVILKSIRQNWARMKPFAAGERLASMGIVDPKPFQNACDRLRHGLIGAVTRTERPYLVTALSLEMWLSLRENGGAKALRLDNRWLRVAAERHA